MIPPSSRSKKGFHDGHPQGNEPGRPPPAAGRPGIRGNGVAFAARDPAPRGGNDLPSAARGTPFPRLRSRLACAAHASHTPPGRGPCACCGSRARPHVCLDLSAPRGQATPRGLTAPRGGVNPRDVTRLVLADLHVPAPDVSGPRWSRPWGRLLIPDQKARRQWTGRSYTPREVAPAQAAPDR